MEEIELGETLATALLGVHKEGSKRPIRMPTAEGEFASSFLHRPPPVVPDANWLRNDILYACRNRQRTILVNGANSDLFRLFCAEHVIDEVFEHSGDWTRGSPVAQREFVQRWLFEYLPVMRVVPRGAPLTSFLGPEECKRIDLLRSQDEDDVPSAALALVLGAFFLSGDGPAVRAVYGPDADRVERTELLDILRAGGDAGELERLIQMVINLLVLAGRGLTSMVKVTADVMGPGALLLAAVPALLFHRASIESKQRLKAAALSAGRLALGLFAAYQAVLDRFHRAAPGIPTWSALSVTNSPETVLSRACMHTLARSPSSTCSAAELAQLLPALDVAQGIAKVRDRLRAQGGFHEVRRGRWQVGSVAGLLEQHLAEVLPEARSRTNLTPPMTGMKMSDPSHVSGSKCHPLHL